MQQQLRINNHELVSMQTKAKSIKQLTSSVADPHKIKTLKIVYSGTPGNPCLKSIESIHRFNLLQVAILKENAITQIRQISSLKNLRELDVTSNYITSLQGIQKCEQLEKIVAFNNCINTFSGLDALSEGNKITYLDLSKNKLTDLGKIRCLQRMHSLKEILFEKKNSSNPICSDKDKYYKALNDFLICKSNELKKIDGFSVSQIVKVVSIQNAKEPKSPEGVMSSEENNMSALNFYGSSSGMEMENEFKRHYPKRQSQGRRHEWEDILKHKDQLLEELKIKNHQLQIANSQQYKELVKKQTQNERIYGQITELSKQLDVKDTKLNEAHRRVESLLSSCGELNKTIELKNEEIERYRKEVSELKIQNAEYRALSKDYEKRMSELHHKALSNVEERTIRTEELKRQNKQLYDQNITMVNDISSLKERVRELTELLREWDYKYETKVNEIQSFHENQKDNFIREADAKLQENNQAYERQIQKMDEEMKKQVQSMEQEYKSALDQTLAKYKEMRANYDEKVQHEKEIKSLMKNLVNKNKQQQNIIQQYEAILVKSRNQLEGHIREKDKLSKQNYTLKLQREDSYRKVADEVTRLTHENNFLQKKLTDVKQTMNSLQYENQRYQNRQKEYMDLQERIQDLTVTIKSQQAMLDDKNETIQALKDQIESIKGYEEKNKEEVYELRKKYDKNKQKLASLENEIAAVLQQNQQYMKTNEELDEKIREQDEDKLKMEKQFDQFQEILEREMKEKEERQKQIRQIIQLLQQCRAQNHNKTQEVQQYKRQIQRGQIQIQDRERKMKKEIYQLEDKYRAQIRKLEEEHDRTKKQAKQKLQRLSKQFLM